MAGGWGASVPDSLCRLCRQSLCPPAWAGQAPMALPFFPASSSPHPPCAPPPTSHWTPPCPSTPVRGVAPELRQPRAPSSGGRAAGSHAPVCGRETAPAQGEHCLRLEQNPRPFPIHPTNGELVPLVLGSRGTPLEYVSSAALPLPTEGSGLTGTLGCSGGTRARAKGSLLPPAWLRAALSGDLHLPQELCRPRPGSWPPLLPLPPRETHNLRGCCVTGIAVGSRGTLSCSQR